MPLKAPISCEKASNWFKNATEAAISLVYRRRSCWHLLTCYLSEWNPLCFWLLHRYTATLMITTDCLGGCGFRLWCSDFLLFSRQPRWRTRCPGSVDELGSLWLYLLRVEFFSTLDQRVIVLAIERRGMGEEHSYGNSLGNICLSWFQNWR